MMKRRTVWLVAVVIGIILLCGFLLLRKDTSLTEQAAVEAVKQKYSALQDYPSDALPPRSISATQSDGKWYLAFIQNGSGRPIVEARCFIVDGNRSVLENGTFVPKPDSPTQNISPVTCDTTP